MAEPLALPHSGLARMARAAARDADGAGRCVVRVPPEHPCVHAGAAPAAVILELGAQAAAALAGAPGGPDGDAPAGPGRVVALKRATWLRPTVPAGVELQVRVQLLDVAPPLRNYAFEVEGCGEGVVSVWTAD